jgi:hypothetical protein
MHFGAFQWDYRGAGFTRQLPNPATPFVLAQPINPLIHESRTLPSFITEEYLRKNVPFLKSPF